MKNAKHFKTNITWIKFKTKQGKPSKTTDSAPLTSDDTEQSDRDTDKLLRNRNSSRFSAKFGKYFGKLGKGSKSREESKANEEGKGTGVIKGEMRDPALRKTATRNTAVKKGEIALKKNESKDIALKKNEARKGKSYAKKRTDVDMKGKLQNSAQSKAQSDRGQNVSAVHGKLRFMTPELDSDSEGKEQHFTRGSRERRSLNNVGTNSKARKNPSVTFSPTVTCTTDSARVFSAQKTKNVTNKKLSTSTHQQKRNVLASETSDTDSTTQELPTV